MANMASVSIRLNPVGIIVLTLVVICALIYTFDIPKLFKCETKVDLKEILSIGIELAERGGRKVKEVRKESETELHEELKGKTKEGVDDVKTAGDMKSHREMTYGFRKMYPELNDNLISEEHESEPADLSKIPSPNKFRPELKDLQSLPSVPISDVTVWIDPLDATKEYTDWGLVGSGHSSNIKPQERDDGERIQPYSVVISRSHTGRASEVIKRSIGNDTKIILAAGAGYKTIEVIKGRADAYVHVTNIKKWDLCAGNAIISSLRGRMTTLDGTNILYTRSGSVVNERGVLATLRDHQILQSKLKPNFDVMKSERDTSSSLKHRESTKNKHSNIPIDTRENIVKS